MDIQQIFALVPEYTPEDWYWQVDGHSGFWSSKASSYVEALPDGWHATIEEAIAAVDGRDPDTGLPKGKIRVPPVAPSEAVLTELLAAKGLLGPLSQPTTADVKAEAERRILAIMPEYQQRNALALFAETTQLYGPYPAEWPEKSRGINAAIMAKWAAIKAIRAKSDKIEAMEPIPSDFRDDRYWR